MQLRNVWIPMSIVGVTSWVLVALLAYLRPFAWSMPLYLTVEATIVGIALHYVCLLYAARSVRLAPTFGQQRSNCEASLFADAVRFGLVAGFVFIASTIIAQGCMFLVLFGLMGTMDGGLPNSAPITIAAFIGCLFLVIRTLTGISIALNFFSTISTKHLAVMLAVANIVGTFIEWYVLSLL